MWLKSVVRVYISGYNRQVLDCFSYVNERHVWKSLKHVTEHMIGDFVTDWWMGDAVGLLPRCMPLNVAAY